MEIQIKYYFIDSGELIKTTLNTFDSDENSVQFLKQIELNKMQTISNVLNKGVYKSSLILKNANSQYDIRLRYDKNNWHLKNNQSFKATDKKPLYEKFVKKCIEV